MKEVIVINDLKEKKNTVVINDLNEINAEMYIGFTLEVNAGELQRYIIMHAPNGYNACRLSSVFCDGASYETKKTVLLCYSDLIRNIYIFDNERDLLRWAMGEND